MSDNASKTTSRRDFLKEGGLIAGAATLVGSAATSAGAFAGESNTIQLAIVGCGGRGTGAVANALTVKNGPIKLVAMADVFAGKLKGSHNALKNLF